MKFKIHFTWPNGTADYVIIAGETIEEIRQKSQSEVASRSGTDPWSEEI